MDKFFKIKENNTTVKTEVIAGITTFITMAYIIFVNPNIIGGDNARISNGVFFATCLASFVGTLLMALLAKIPFAQAPGMGLNAFFAYTVMPSMIVLSGRENASQLEQYQMALSIVFISGILFILITALGLRELIINAIPKYVKLAIPAGIGLFLAFLGLQSSGLVVANSSTLVTLNSLSDFSNPSTRGALITLIGVFIISALYKKRVKGALIIGILVSTVLSYVPVIGTSSMPKNLSLGFADQFKDFLDVSFLSFGKGFEYLFNTKDLIAVIIAVVVLIISFSLVDMFDTIGAILGTAKQADLLDENGNMPQMKKALLSDALATTAGAMLGTSTVTTYVESSAGIGEGGKTGLTSLVTSILFLLAIFMAPFIGLVPPSATSAALIFVGVLMMSTLKEIDFTDIEQAIPAFLTIVMMPLTYSIANGVAFGILSYMIIRVLTGNVKGMKMATVVLALIFIVRYLFFV